MYTEPGVGPDENPRSRHRASFMPLLARRAVVRQSDPLGSPSGTAPVNWAVLAEPVARESCMGEIPDLFFFKALTREFQCPAVLCDRANDVIRGSRRHLGCYFEGHRDLSSHQAGKMRDHLVSASLLDQTGHVDRCLLVPSGYCLVHIFSNVVNLDVRLARGPGVMVLGCRPAYSSTVQKTGCSRYTGSLPLVRIISL